MICRESGPLFLFNSCWHPPSYPVVNLMGKVNRLLDDRAGWLYAAERRLEIGKSPEVQ